MQSSFGKYSVVILKKKGKKKVCLLLAHHMRIKKPDDSQWPDVPEFIVLGDYKLLMRDVEGRDKRVKR
jgi:hypothetical protein